jgi:hypothetical protein
MTDFMESATTETEAATTETEVQTPETPAGVAEWVGEGKKYATADELAKGYANADQRLEELKLDNQRIATERDEALAKSKGVDDVLAAINAQTVAETPTTPTTVTEPMSAEALQTLVNSSVATQRDEEKRQERVTSTWSMMDEAFGDRVTASLAVTAYIGDDPGKKAIVNSMALSDPTGLMKLLGKDVERKTTTFTRDRTAATPEQLDLNQPLTWAVAKQVRKDNPTLYYTHGFRQRMDAELPK